MKALGHPDPVEAAELVVKLSTTNEGPDLSLSVLDMGCGTGLVGEELHKRGFRDIVGCDASQGMVDKAKEKKSYSELSKLFLGKPETFPDEYKERFDFITGTAILAEGHLTGGAVFDEMMMALKTGGYSIFTTRDEYMTKYGYTDAIEKLVDEGKWKKVHDSIFVKYHNVEEGKSVGRYSAKPTRMYAYQKL